MSGIPAATSAPNEGSRRRGAVRRAGDRQQMVPAGLRRPQLRLDPPMNCRSRPVLPVVLAALLASGFVARAADRIEVVKPAGQRNPTLMLKSFSGGDAVRAQLLNDLLYSDWFTVVEAGPADYVLGVVWQESGNEKSFDMELLDAAGNRLGRWQQKGTVPTRWLVHAAVDGLIRLAFKNPGFCNTQLAFVREQGGKKEVYLSDFDGSQATRLTFNDGLSVEPDWSPDGRQLVYTYYDGTATQVVLVDLQAQRQKRLCSYPGLNCGAAFSNDGKRLAMSLSLEDNVELYLRDVGGVQLTRLTRSKGVEASPCWAPDDRRVCYVSDDAGSSPTLLLLGVGGGQAERLTRLPEEAVSPDWSPVSNRIVFATRRGSGYVLAMVDMNEADRTPQVLTNTAGSWESPSWTADGRHIVCSRREGSEQRLYLVDSFFQRQLPLPAGAGRDSLPSCGPQRR